MLYESLRKKFLANQTMTDPYLPPLSEFSWTPEELAVIEIALKHSDPWNEKAVELAAIKEPLKLIKAKIRSLHMQRQHSTCCYCRVNLAGGGPFMVDREHILPKKKYPSLTFVLSNLSVSCKRCNMEFKGDNVDFVVDPSTIEAGHGSSERYRFVHPNYDKWSVHLGRTTQQEDEFVLVKFRVKNESAKGSYTYAYFRLDQLEVDNFDQAQGGNERHQDEQEIRNQLEAEYGQSVP